MEVAGHFPSERDFRRGSGERLRLLIDALGIKYVDAAEDMGVSSSHLGNMMRGVALPPYAIYRFCRRRGVTMDWIFLGDPSGLRETVAKALMQPRLLEADRSASIRQAPKNHEKDVEMKRSN